MSVFKFEIWWLEVEDFKNKVKNGGESFKVNGRPGFVLAEELKILKAKGVEQR